MNIDRMEFIAWMERIMERFDILKEWRAEHQERTSQHRRRGITRQPRPTPHAENQPPLFATIPFHGQIAVLHH